MGDVKKAGSILIISHEIVGQCMAGPGIRYFHLARILSREFDVTLAIPNKVSANFDDVPFQIKSYQQQDWASIESLVNLASVVIFPSDIASNFPQLAESEASLVVDGYDPLLAEWLATRQTCQTEEELSCWQSRMLSLHQQYLIGDFFICASERQRTWWLGLLEANGRINPWVFHEDRSLRSLVDVVPYGFPEAVPEHTHAVVKGVWPGIGVEDKVILWGGGLWPWLDPLTAIRAVALVWEKRQDVRLIFPGTRHPNPQMKEISTYTEDALQLALDLDLLDKAVFFGDWVPYADWPNVLLESDIALTLHFDTIETQLAFRSRLLDYIWVGLPVVAARGDATSDLVADYGLGKVVDYEDAAGVAEAILELLDGASGDMHVNFERARQALSWERAAEPLVRFCRSPRRAPDRRALGAALGNPFHVEAQSRLAAERDYWQNLAKRYEQGRFMRFMRWIHGLRGRD